MSFESLEGLVREDIIDAASRTWEQLASPGAVWSGSDRVGIAREARAARQEDWGRTGLSAAAVEAARLLATAPAEARVEWVEGLVGSGLQEAGYVELVGIVARMVAVDTLCMAAAGELEPLPQPLPGKPSGRLAPHARRGRAWVPMVGGRSITQALSLVPSENREVERLHGTLYLSYEQMDDPTIRRGLSRPQMELVAARTSAHNKCFY